MPQGVARQLLDRLTKRAEVLVAAAKLVVRLQATLDSIERLAIQLTIKVCAE